MAAAHGGQVLLSEAMSALLAERLPAGITLRDLGSVRLRGLVSPERIRQVVHSRLQHDFPPLRSMEATPNNLPPRSPRSSAATTNWPKRVGCLPCRAC